VPFVRVDAEGDVLFDIFDAPNVTACLPRKLVVRGPCRTHAEKGSMGDSLGVCGNAIVLLGGEVDVLRSETGHDILDEGEVIVGSAVLDQDQWLALRVYTWTV
jgi:hypothetical protein